MKKKDGESREEIGIKENSRSVVEVKRYQYSERQNSKIFENLKIRNDLRFDQLVSPKKAAELLDVSVKFVYESIARQEIRAERVGGRLRRIRLSALEAWLATQQRGV